MTKEQKLSDLKRLRKAIQKLKLKQIDHYRQQVYNSDKN